jgi:hypothetical protein
VDVWVDVLQLRLHVNGTVSPSTEI